MNTRRYGVCGVQSPGRSNAFNYYIVQVRETYVAKVQRKRRRRRRCRRRVGQGKQRRRLGGRKKKKKTPKTITIYHTRVCTSLLLRCAWQHPVITHAGRIWPQKSRLQSTKLLLFFPRFSPRAQYFIVLNTVLIIASSVTHTKRNNSVIRFIYIFLYARCARFPETT